MKFPPRRSKARAVSPSKASRDRRLYSPAMVEVLEKRELLARYDGFGGFLSGALDNIRDNTLTGFATQASLPVIGLALDQAVQKKEILAGVTVADGSNETQGDLTAAIKTAFGANNTSVTYANSGDRILIHSIGTKDLSVPKIDLGLPSLGFSTAASLTAHLTYTLDLTIIKSNSNYALDAGGTTPELTLSVSVLKAEVPSFDGRLGPLYVHADPIDNTTSNQFLNAQITVDVQGGVISNANKYTAVAKIGGGADLAFTLRAGLRPLDQADANLQLVVQSFRVVWPFSDSQGNPLPANVTSAQLGRAPTVQFNDVQLKLGSLLNNLAAPLADQILKHAQPVFDFTSYLTRPIPMLADVSKQVKGLLGNFDVSAAGPAGQMLQLLQHPDLLGLLSTAAQFSTDPKVKGYANTFVDAVRQVDQVGSLLAFLQAGSALTIHVGNFTIGGGNDLRSFSGDLKSVARDDKPASKSAIDSALGSFKSELNKYDLSIPLLDDPSGIFRLLLGDSSVKLLEYDNKIDVARNQSYDLYNQNFVIGIVPVNFKLHFDIPDVSFHLIFGIDASGLSTGKPQDGLYVGAGNNANRRVFNADMKLGVDFAIGADVDVVTARAGITAGLNGNVNAYFPAQGNADIAYLRNLASCPLAGSGTLTATADLFTEVGVNFNLESLAKLVETLLANNPLIYQADLMLKASDKIIAVLNAPPLNLGVPPVADKLRNLVSGGNFREAISEGLSDAGATVSDGFKSFMKNPTQAVEGFVNSLGNAASNAGGAIGSGVTTAVETVGGWFSLADNTSISGSRGLYRSKPLYQWSTGQCNATTLDGGGTTPTVNSNPDLGELGSVSSDGTLTLFIGQDATKRFIKPDAIDEVFVIRAVDENHPDNGSVYVTAFGLTRRYDKVKRIVGDGGTGDDVIDAAGVGLQVNFAGGSGNDTLIAGTVAATLSGGSGNDTLRGGRGNDYLDGGSGDDELTGGEGDDTLLGGTGNDRIYGDFAPDTPEDDASDPSHYGNDYIDAGAGNDTVYGGPGADLIYGGDGNDRLDGGAGNDTIYGEAGNDTLFGGTGHDFLDGGAGTDRLEGGAGNDTLRGGDKDDATADTLLGGDNADLIYGTAGANIIFGGAGNDTIFGYAGDDVILGNEGDDWIDGGDNNDIIAGGSGNDTLYGGAGSDFFVWGDGDNSDLIEGGSGQNRLIFTGSQTLGANSTFTVRRGAGNRLVASLRVGSGIDAADIQSLLLQNSSGGRDTFQVGDLKNTGVALVDVFLSDKASSAAAFDGTGGNDEVFVDAVAGDLIVEGLSAHIVVHNAHVADRLTINGLAGNDRIIATSIASSTVGIILDGGAGNDYLEADATLLGGDGNDTLIGGTGDDLLDGGDGDDVLFGGTGNNTLIGGAGNDTILINGTDFADIIILGEVTPGTLTTSINGASGSNLYSSIERITIHGLGGNDFINAGSVATALVITGDDGDDVIIGGLGADFLDGGRGNDSINGSAGNDTLYGGEGNDTLTGGTGNDQLFGGDGSDTIVWNNGDNSDLVEGGEGTDIAIINGASAGDAFTVTPNGVRIKFDRTNLVPFTLDIAGIEQMNINSGAGNDTIAVSDLTGTELKAIKIDLGTGDGTQDIVTIDGSNLADDIAITQAGPAIDVTGLYTRFSITGSAAGSDVLQVRGNGGDDRIKADSGVERSIGIQLEGGAGNDFLSADATLLGGLGDDTLIGGTGPDVLLGGAGNDLIIGGEGDDLLMGDADGTGVGASFAIIAIASGHGNDTLDGGAGNDTINGDLGDDSLLGGDGNDLLGPVTVGGIAFADPGNDTMRGGAGNDTLNGDSGDDSLFGDAGDDSLLGGLGNDTLFGGDGNDTLFGEAGNDYLVGDAGNDSLDGGDGDDALDGSDGNDTLLGQAGNDLILGRGGNDLIVGGDGNDTLSGGDGDDTITGNAGDDYLAGDAGNDYLDGGDGADTLDGGDGNDTLLGQAGNDLLLGMAGRDLIAGGDGDDTVSGGDGDDTITGDAGNDYLAGDDGNDFIDGGSGNDTLDGGAGADTLLGQAGNDLLMGMAGNDSLNGGSGNDTLHGGDGNDTLVGELGNDVLLGEAGNDLLTGDDGDDSLSGGDGNDSLYGGTGNDLIQGGRGDDLIHGGDGNDTLSGDEGNDSIFGEAGNDQAYGGDGNDTILGGDGNDTLVGDAGDDKMFGEAGHDILLGGAGNDSLDGGAGNDTLFGGDGNDTILGGDGDDRLGGDAGDDLILAGAGNDTAQGGTGNDQIWGDAGDDVLYGDDGNDTILGGDGNDTILGGAGNDLLFGNAGNDQILGGFGDDSLYGGTGDDTLHGGNGIPNIPHSVRDNTLPDDGADVILGGTGFDLIDGGTGNNLLDAGDDGIAETVLAGQGNDIVFGHWDHDGNRDTAGLDGGYNRVYVQGGLVEPGLPAETNSPMTFIVNIQAPTGRYVEQPGDGRTYLNDPLPPTAVKRITQPPRFAGRGALLRKLAAQATRTNQIAARRLTK
ncbi:beta strand repeat-containing protein [Singulisphaera acidiphila]|uniref:Ca2+-binding protein, RTX toxin n=1 Tax=Singulisphaera acidiphila (strain ATCC BAA-1392 / DSM 18658 / VKM B-2454 / MOB10) TaxID=886293 RepID=L0DR81_SINAD|nr:hypothetical protein [Singulisphaera acidiphila]AGA31515.1 Ca2+-binding protein, RTX toxin [Singulisphaera acidiphila DSM 18658]